MLCAAIFSKKTILKTLILVSRERRLILQTSNTSTFSIPNSLSRTINGGAIQLVVQEALETTRSSAFIKSSFTPITKVGVSSFIGAETITLFAPACKCFPASSFVLLFPVDSTTISIFKSFHGKFSGSFSVSTIIL